MEHLHTVFVYNTEAIHYCGQYLLKKQLNLCWAVQLNLLVVFSIASCWVSFLFAMIHLSLHATFTSSHTLTHPPILSLTHTVPPYLPTTWKSTRYACYNTLIHPSCQVWSTIFSHVHNYHLCVFFSFILQLYNLFPSFLWSYSI